MQKRSLMYLLCKLLGKKHNQFYKGNTFSSSFPMNSAKTQTLNWLNLGWNTLYFFYSLFGRSDSGAFWFCIWDFYGLPSWYKSWYFQHPCWVWRFVIKNEVKTGRQLITAPIWDNVWMAFIQKRFLLSFLITISYSLGPNQHILERAFWCYVFILEIICMDFAATDSKCCTWREISMDKHLEHLDYSEEISVWMNHWPKQVSFCMMLNASEILK